MPVHVSPGRATSAKRAKPARSQAVRASCTSTPAGSATDAFSRTSGGAASASTSATAPRGAMVRSDVQPASAPAATLCVSAGSATAGPAAGGHAMRVVPSASYRRPPRAEYAAHSSGTLTAPSLAQALSAPAGTSSTAAGSASVPALPSGTATSAVKSLL